MSVTPENISADGISTAIVRAVVLDFTGLPVTDGMTVHFSTTAGYIEPFAVTSLGIATATLSAPISSGPAEITATCGYAVSWGYCNFLAGPVSDISIIAGSDTSTVVSDLTIPVIIEAADSYGNPAASGALINLSLSDSDRGFLADDVVTIDSTGFASTLFTAGTESGICWIRASSGAVVDSTYITIRGGTPTTVVFTASDSTIHPLGTGGIDQATIYAHIYDGYGNPVADSADVVFSVVDYPTGGLTDPVLSPPGTGLVSSTRYTFGGRATITLRAGDRSGIVEIQANIGSGTVISSAPIISISGGLATSISLTNSLFNVPGWMTDGLENTITAQVTDAWGNPVSSGTAVSFYTEEGMITGSAVTDESGVATATWTSSDPRNDGDVWVFASTEGASGTVVDSSAFYMSGPPASIPALTTLDSSISANGVSSTIVRAEVVDVNYNPVADGLYSLNFVTTKGTISGSPAAISYSDGVGFAEAEVTLVSEVCVEDYYPGDPHLSQADITAYRGGISNTTSMFFDHGSPSMDNSEITGSLNVGSGGTIPIQVTAKDVWDNPIAGAIVTFASSDGSVAPGTAVTNESGYATASFTAPNVTDDLPVTIYANIGSGPVVYYSITVVAP